MVDEVTKSADEKKSVDEVKKSADEKKSVDEVKKSADEVKKSADEKNPKKPIFILIFIFLVLFFLYYSEFAKEHARLVEEHRIAALEFDANAKECLAEKAIRDAEEALNKRLAAKAAEEERLRAIKLKVITDFYKAVNEKDCATAVELRANYSEKECRKIWSVRVNAAKIVKEAPTIAVVYLKIAYRQHRRNYHFSGYVQLGKQGDGWIILGNFSSKLNLEDYIKRYPMSGAR